jgi:hypothetical protein
VLLLSIHCCVHYHSSKLTTSCCIVLCSLLSIAGKKLSRFFIVLRTGEIDGVLEVTADGAHKWHWDKRFFRACLAVSFSLCGGSTDAAGVSYRLSGDSSNVIHRWATHGTVRLYGPFLHRNEALEHSVAGQHLTTPHPTVTILVESTCNSIDGKPAGLARAAERLRLMPFRGPPAPELDVRCVWERLPALQHQVDGTFHSAEGGERDHIKLSCALHCFDMPL